MRERESIPIEEYISEPIDVPPLEQYWFLCPKCNTIRYAYRKSVACPDCLNVMILWGTRTFVIEPTFTGLIHKVEHFVSKQKETLTMSSER